MDRSCCLTELDGSVDLVWPRIQGLAVFLGPMASGTLLDLGHVLKNGRLGVSGVSFLELVMVSLQCV